MGTLNRTVLMSGVDYFDDTFAINPFMDASDPIDRVAAIAEHNHIKSELQAAGIEVVHVPAPEGCQDGVYTANWALVRGDNAVMARLPNARQCEEPHAERILRNLGKTIHHIPEGLKFSGQGDALACGDMLFINSGYRTDAEAHAFIAQTLGYQLVPLRTIPLLDRQGRPVINKASGWPDSYFYDIDLALAVLRAPSAGQKGLIAYCPEAFLPDSRAALESLTSVDKIIVDFDEAMHGFACNLVSTGSTVVMGRHAPKLRAALEARGFTIRTPEITELAKGGGYIRCITLTLA